MECSAILGLMPGEEMVASRAKGLWIKDATSEPVNDLPPLALKSKKRKRGRGEMLEVEARVRAVQPARAR
jgi:hypothetical protein